MHVQSPKRWALDLKVEPSEITRWASGERRFGVDDLAAAERIAIRMGRLDVLFRISELQGEARGDADLPDEMAPPCPRETLKEHGHTFAAGVDALLAATDGITDEECDDLDDLGERLNGLAAKVRAIVRAHRRSTRGPRAVR